MQFFTQGYLRVTSPMTIDGTHPKYDEQGRIMYKETELPLTAKKHIDRQNSRLPDHLKKKIEVIGPDGPAAIQPEPQGTKAVDIPSGTFMKKRFSTIGNQHLVRK